MNDLSAQQIAILERLIAHGFAGVAFPLYANAIGVRKGSCAALLDPVANAGFRIYGAPSLLIEGNLTVRIADQGKSWFVWKKTRVEATAERVAELEGFVAELTQLLEPHLT